MLVALPTRGEVFADVRGDGRVLRVSWHHDQGVAVLSLWHHDRCTATVRVAASDVPGLVAALTAGLAQGYAADAAAPPG